MKTRMMGQALQANKRARTQARRLGAIVKQYQDDPERNYWRHSEAVSLARKVSANWRTFETVGRVILTDRGDRRQVFLPDVDSAV
ncbi:hypothetical protein [Massilia putida]|uniref:hypothetical protein n=1 Tax=Massilia putida TaxID=1141883 RepID=UPI0012EB2525|nr:hypothetical protein [Massilia putida]